MAKESKLFDLQDVINGICDKMVRRHPHVFADSNADSADAVVTNWETIKADERKAKVADKSAMADVAITLPALLRAQKLQKRAARTGFDWPDVEGAFDKLQEEILEVREARNETEQFEEVGDLLYAAVNVSRHYGVDAEAALKAANAKFEKRFRAMEHHAGAEFAELSLDAKEALWIRVKAET